MNPLISIIILNWNRLDDTLECLASLAKLDYAPSQVCIIDNACSVDSVELIKREFPDTRVIQNKQNLGFVEANNIGIQQALVDGADFILLLNNDTTVDKNFLRELVLVAEREPSAGVFGPKILSYREPNRIWFAGPRKTYAFGRPLELGHRGFGEIDRGQYDQARKVGFISGCAMMIRREVIEKVGFLDPDFFAYFEDADYCLRANKVGFDLIYAPQARIWHKADLSGMDAQTYSPLALYLGVRNRLLFMKKHGNRIGWCIFLPIFLASLLRTWAILAMKRKPDVSRTILHGIFDFLQGNFGNGNVALFSK